LKGTNHYTPPDSGAGLHTGVRCHIKGTRIIKTMAAPTARNNTLLPAVLAVLFIIAAVSWLSFAPPGLLGKADALGYAVCHRIEERSFMIGGRPLPLCARCTGIFLGALFGMLYQLPQGRRAQFPSLRFSLVLGLFVLVFAVDGVNSFLKFIPGFPGLYEPSNPLRLFTGLGVGVTVAVVLYPLFNQTVWLRAADLPAIRSWRQLGGLVLLAALLAALVLSGIPALLYPLALLSGGTVLLLLGMCYTVLWIIITRSENTYERLAQLWPAAAAGFTVALLQVLTVDALRLHLTGTWGGLPMP